MLGPPEALVARALEDTLAGRAAWVSTALGLREHLQAQIRRRFRCALEVEAQARGRAHAPWQARLSTMQIGDLEGLERVFHHAGVMAHTFRRGDRDVRACAQRLAAYVQ
jgi:hypothetical protein